jgi:hypothetical protein
MRAKWSAGSRNRRAPTDIGPLAAQRRGIDIRIDSSEARGLLWSAEAPLLPRGELSPLACAHMLIWSCR